MYTVSISLPTTWAWANTGPKRHQRKGASIDGEIDGEIVTGQRRRRFDKIIDQIAGTLPHFHPTLVHASNQIRGAGVGLLNRATAADAADGVIWSRPRPRPRPRWWRWTITTGVCRPTTVTGAFFLVVCLEV